MRRRRCSSSSPGVGEEDATVYRSGMDWMTITMAIMALMVFVVLPFINPPARTQTPEQKVFYASLEWDVCLPAYNEDFKSGAGAADVDFYAKLIRPGEGPDVIGFSSPDRKSKYFTLNKDDLGGSYGDQTDSDEEIIISRGSVLYDGNYTVNAHLFGDKGDIRKKGGEPICARVIVVVYKGLPEEQVVCDNVIELHGGQKEQTGCRFRVINGEVEILPNIFSPVRGAARSGPP